MSTLSQFFSGKLKSQEFTSSGSFTVPAGISTVLVTMTGGGASGSNATGANGWGAGGGGSGAYTIKRAVNVTPGASISVSVGGGGAGATNSPGSGNNGNPTSFGPSVSVSGGEGGIRASPGVGYYGGGGGARGGGAITVPANSGHIINPPESIGGIPGPHFGLRSITGAGAGGLFGDGTTTANAPANSGAGSGGTTTAPSTGSGGSGRCIVEWIG